MHHQNSLVMVKLLKKSRNCTLNLLGAWSCCSLVLGDGPASFSPEGW